MTPKEILEQARQAEKLRQQVMDLRQGAAGFAVRGHLSSAGNALYYAHKVLLSSAGDKWAKENL